MKYLVTATERPGAEGPGSPEELRELLLAERAWIQDRHDDGSVLALYDHAGGGASVALVEAASHDDVQRLILSFPGWMTNNWQVVALCDWRVAMDAVIEQLGAG